MTLSEWLLGSGTGVPLHNALTINESQTVMMIMIVVMWNDDLRMTLDLSSIRMVGSG